MHPQRSVTIFGFDSAWSDKARGAICALSYDAAGRASFHPPQRVSFQEAIDFVIEHSRGVAVSLIAIDQPSLVPNKEGSRPVDRVAAAQISFIGGGVQPANRSKVSMFGDNAPIWRFLEALKAQQDPPLARSATSGLFVMEVFPALALAAFEDRFAQRRGAPKYNPANRSKFRLADWKAVTRVTQNKARQFGLTALTDWAMEMGTLARPRKADQDRLDAALCALVGLYWRAGPAGASVMLGDLSSGYMITPLSDAIQPRLEAAAAQRGVAWLLAPELPSRSALSPKPLLR